MPGLFAKLLPRALQHLPGLKARMRHHSRVTTDCKLPAPLPNGASIVVLTLAHRVETELAAALAPLNLTVSRLAILGHIASAPQVSFSRLARVCGISVQSVHSSVRAMAAEGLVHDRTSRAGSASAIELTATGKQRLRAADDVLNGVDERLFGPAADTFQREVGAVAVAAFARRTPARARL